jgi:hypothetical protein
MIKNLLIKFLTYSYQMDTLAYNLKNYKDNDKIN